MAQKPLTTLFPSITRDSPMKKPKTKSKDFTSILIFNSEKMLNSSIKREEDLIKPLNREKVKPSWFAEVAFKKLKPDQNKVPDSSQVIMLNLEDLMISKDKSETDMPLKEPKSKTEFKMSLEGCPMDQIFNKSMSMTASLTAKREILRKRFSEDTQAKRAKLAQWMLREI